MEKETLTKYKIESWLEETVSGTRKVSERKLVVSPLRFWNTKTVDNR